MKHALKQLVVFSACALSTAIALDHDDADAAWVRHSAISCASISAEDNPFIVIPPGGVANYASNQKAYACGLTSSSDMRLSDLYKVVVNGHDSSAASGNDGRIRARACVTFYAGNATGGACGNYDQSGAGSTGPVFLQPDVGVFSQYSSHYPSIQVWLAGNTGGGASVLNGILAYYD